MMILELPSLPQKNNAIIERQRMRVRSDKGFMNCVVAAPKKEKIPHPLRAAGPNALDEKE